MSDFDQQDNLTTGHAASGDSPVARALKNGRLIVCSGPGGVGKTTTAAALGLRGALMGRKTIVLTIDPARRLANSLGLDELTNTPQPIALDGQIDLAIASQKTSASQKTEPDTAAPGELWAMMLDQEQTLAELVARHAPDPGALDRARENNIYRLLSSALHGMQEYMALEKLHDLYTAGYFDLVILDTPPTKNALDFLETPRRASRFFDDRIVKWFLPDRSSSKGFFGRVLNPGAVVQGLLSKIFGDSFITDLIEFFDTFQYLFEVLKERGDMIEFILRDPNTYFVVITSADPRRIKEAQFFNQKLEALGQKAQAFIINRVTPDFDPADLDALDSGELSGLLKTHGLSDPTLIETTAQALKAHYRRLASRAQKDRAVIAELAEKFSAERLQAIPLLGQDVHTLGALLKLSAWLTPAPSA